MQDCNSQEKQDVNLSVVHTIAEPDLIEFRFFKALNEIIRQYMIIVDLFSLECSQWLSARIKPTEETL